MHSDTASARIPTATTHAAPTWDPQQYLRHAGHRTRPFLDLLNRIPELPTRPARIADLGCGPGNVTALLAERWPEAHITGFDLSPEMLRRATDEYAGRTTGGGSLDFRHGDLASWHPEEPYDLIVSNAALQWVPSHPGSFAAWINGLRPGGTFAFQIPGNFTAPSHALLAELCDSPRWRGRLAGHGARYIHLLEPAEYLARFTELGCAVDTWETTYHQLLSGPDPVLDWVKGTALRPVLTALGGDRDAVDAFLAEYRDLLREAYPPGPRGTVFPFRRIFAVARKEL
ncbi:MULTISPECIES: trans-aconitate 2-methyltransferase [unclassified Streptomyces]|uniref:Trans-aconitate 2-methyltransferase n=1 Tax=Streptomyces sp. R33 TaxID=3238629 RepID=A0AB39Y8W1_9ACTN|nr:MULTISPECIES: trans-aconitate 2-methyltransferase [unclassified Streptomyces]KJY46504.1 trans-aconitate methyltransferase [Streptomyces sp. NRRL S-444]KOY50241.1 trans-aconitate methyltransferase [Streptomyces sp. XY332]THA36884.1 trans-aconitate 2-methyltransferase [Streptomyces sp. A1547]